jgi:hypothetical protein
MVVRKDSLKEISKPTLLALVKMRGVAGYPSSAERPGASGGLAASES